jgi:hypothetical protein
VHLQDVPLRLVKPGDQDDFSAHLNPFSPLVNSSSISSQAWGVPFEPLMRDAFPPGQFRSDNPDRFYDILYFYHENPPWLSISELVNRFCKKIFTAELQRMQRKLFFDNDLHPSE